MANVLVLGGTGWLGRTIAGMALADGDSVTCFARGVTGAAVVGTHLIRADRSDDQSYAALEDVEWDLVLELSWQPGWVHDALRVIGDRARHWVYVSSCSVYVTTDTPGADETAALAVPLHARTADRSQYGPAKSACEEASRNAVSDRLLIVRPGLIGGPGDPSDRTTYWPHRFALAQTEPVLVPDALEQRTQVIDVRDLARWVLTAGKNGVTGTYNTVGQSTLLTQALADAAAAAGFMGQEVRATEPWLVEQAVDYWAGPRSLPLWLPSTPDFAGYSSRDDTAFLTAGGHRRSLRQTFTDILATQPDARTSELKAGLPRAEELSLISSLMSP